MAHKLNHEDFIGEVFTQTIASTTENKGRKLIIETMINAEDVQTTVYVVMINGEEMYRGYNLMSACGVYNP